MELYGIFSRRIISNNLWPPRRADLTPYDFYYWGTLKNMVYARNPHIINKFEDYTGANIE